MGNKIIKNSIYNVIYKVFSVLFPLVTTSYISRILLAEGVGKVAYSQTIVTYFITIACLGIPQYGIKCIAQSGDKNNRSQSFCELFTINLFSTVCCIVVYFLVINFIPYFESKRSLHNVMGLLLILNVFNVDWFYQGIEEYSYIATRSIIIKALSFVIMLLLVKNKEDYIIYGFILCFATAGNYLMNMFNIRKYISFKFNQLNIKRHLKPVIILLASAVATEIYTMLDTVMIEHFHGDECVGYYSNTVKTIRIAYTLVIAVVATFYPQISKYLKEKKFDESNRLLSIGLKMIVMIAVPMTAGLFIMSSDLVVLLLGKDFLNCIITLRIMSILIIVFSFAYFLGHIILMSTGNEKKILYATICGACSNFVLNMILIPLIRHNGAAIASVIAEVVVTILLIYNSRKYIHLNITKKYCIDIVLATIIMIAVLIPIEFFISSRWVRTVLGVCVGGSVYLGYLFVRGNEMLNRVLGMVSNKVKKKSS